MTYSQRTAVRWAGAEMPTEDVGSWRFADGKKDRSRAGLILEATPVNAGRRLDGWAFFFRRRDAVQVGESWHGLV